MTSLRVIILFMRVTKNESLYVVVNQTQSYAHTRILVVQKTHDVYADSSPSLPKNITRNKQTKFTFAS
ncbi:hypothetical protein EYC84_001989 [Monilinia fructicola]|uniref:Uncharacterized protein n=1 Tax=Monilinia fructicola TaxID=38448 RepID=A0A5M9JRD4_MONFR|nr:hypothetical protein EYC84_001989 [Monilinia fructicola]